MRYEISRTFPTRRRSGYEYLTDLTMWSEWSPICIPDAEGARFSDPDDLVAYTYRPIGVPVRGTMRLVEAKEGELWKLRFEQRAFTDVEMTWSFENAGAHAFTLTVAIEIEDPHWWDKTYQRVSMMPWTIRRDVRHAMGELHGHFSRHAAEVEVKAAS